jgi:glycosyltransferase involved in cell wall biosynthesis
MENPLISICIPGYEMNSKGSLFLNQLLQTIQKQTYKEFEIIISDHSENNSLFDTVNLFKNLNIVIFKNGHMRGSSSANINSAIKRASGDIIKIMFQDDFFVSVKALEKIITLPYDKHWGVCGCVHAKGNVENFYNRLVPYWQDGIKRGVNTLGGPSSIFLRKTDVVFDERLLWFMDTDYYYRLFQKYGEPFIIAEPLICSREDDTRVSNTLITTELVEKETKIINEKNIYNKV